MGSGAAGKAGREGIAKQTTGDLKGVKAKAFTIGHDIFFARPGDAEDREILVQGISRVVQLGGWADTKREGREGADEQMMGSARQLPPQVAVLAKGNGDCFFDCNTLPDSA